jgi:poly(3-hydroxybutyrate) depolymerase
VKKSIAVGALVGVVVVLALAFFRRAPAVIEHPIEAGPTWCAPGFEPIEGGCLAGTGPLVVYLHGRYALASLPGEVDRQTRLAKMAVARGFSVLALRGRQGQCIAPELADHWCWPSNERNEDDAKTYVADFTTAIEAAETRVGKSKRYLLGFSNGGYFAAIFATRALLPFDAIAIAGAGPVEPTRAWKTKPPILLITADDDFSCESMLELDRELVRESWPHDIVSRDGGHELTDGDMDAALTFFTRLNKETLPFGRPMSDRKPSPHFHVDGGPIVNDAGD